MPEQHYYDFNNMKKGFVVLPREIACDPRLDVYEREIEKQLLLNSRDKRYVAISVPFLVKACGAAGMTIESRLNSLADKKQIRKLDPWCELAVEVRKECGVREPESKDEHPCNVYEILFIDAWTTVERVGWYDQEFKNEFEAVKAGFMPVTVDGSRKAEIKKNVYYGFPVSELKEGVVDDLYSDVKFDLVRQYREGNVLREYTLGDMEGNPVELMRIEKALATALIKKLDTVHELFAVWKEAKDLRVDSTEAEQAAIQLEEEQQRQELEQLEEQRLYRERIAEKQKKLHEAKTGEDWWLSGDGTYYQNAVTGEMIDRTGERIQA